MAVVVALAGWWLFATARRQGFHWQTFRAVLAGLEWRWLLLASLCAVATYYGRALRWAVLIRPVTFLILLTVTFMIAFGIVSLLAGSRPARFYVIAWGAFLAGSIVFLLKTFGLVPHTFMTQHSWQVGASKAA